MLKKIKINYLFFFILFFYCLLINAKLFANSNIVTSGKNDAKVIVKVFSSLTCPHCANFHKKIYYEMEKDFIEKGFVKFEHHGFPLDMAAFNAEKLLMCPDTMKKKMNFLNEIYESQESWAVGSDINIINNKLAKIAKNYDLNDDKIKSCLNSEKMEEEILNDRIRNNKKYSITSTPTIFINERKYEGKHNYEDFKKEIEKIL